MRRKLLMNSGSSALWTMKIVVLETQVMNLTSMIRFLTTSAKVLPNRIEDKYFLYSLNIN